MTNIKSSILSFIIPVYNVASYLRKCVDSLLAQDYDDYEIILVDDGSTDGSGKICDEYAEKHDNIRVIHQHNAGLSAARNSGIKMAKGEYICFVDSDDYWQPNVLASLMAQIQREQLDVFRFDYQNVRVDSVGQYEPFQPNKYSHPVDSRADIVSGSTYLDERMGYACYAVMFIIRREIVLNNFFKQGIHFEDVEWLPRMMLNAKRVNSTPMVVYNYLVRQGSITQTQGDKAKICKNLNDRMAIIAQYASYRTQYPNCQWLKNMQSSLTVGVLTSVSRYFYEERKDYIARLNALGVFPISIADQGRTYVRRARIINTLGPLLFCNIMHIRL